MLYTLQNVVHHLSKVDPFPDFRLCQQNGANVNTGLAYPKDLKGYT